MTETDYRQASFAAVLPELVSKGGVTFEPVKLTAASNVVNVIFRHIGWDTKKIYLFIYHIDWGELDELNDNLGVGEIRWKQIKTIGENDVLFSFIYYSPLLLNLLVMLLLRVLILTNNIYKCKSEFFVYLFGDLDE